MFGRSRGRASRPSTPSASCTSWSMYGHVPQQQVQDRPDELYPYEHAPAGVPVKCARSMAALPMPIAQLPWSMKIQAWRSLLKVMMVIMATRGLGYALENYAGLVRMHHAVRETEVMAREAVVRSGVKWKVQGGKCVAHTAHFPLSTFHPAHSTTRAALSTFHPAPSTLPEYLGLALRNTCARS